MKLETKLKQLEIKHRELLQGNKDIRKEIEEKRHKKFKLENEIQKLQSLQDGIMRNNYNQRKELENEIRKIKQELYINAIKYENDTLHTTDISIKIPKNHVIMMEKFPNSINLTILKEGSKTATFKTTLRIPTMSHENNIIDEVFDKIKKLIYTE